MKKLIFIITLILTTTQLYAKTDIYPPARNIYLHSVTGNRIRLNEDLANKPVIMIFWASWCKPCIQKIYEFEKVKKKYPDIEIITIALGDNWKTMRKYKKNFPFPIYYGGKRVATIYKVWGMPTIYLLDKEHRVRDKFSGNINIKRIFSAIKTHLK